MINSTVSLSGRTTTRIGFGTAGLHGGWSRNSSLRLLDHAYDIGIRHFDCAPLYGLGAAESVVGDFLRGKEESVTVTTKYGLFPPSSPQLWEFGRMMLGPIVRRAPVLKKRILKSISIKAAPTNAPSNRFKSEQIDASLKNSLRLFGRDQVDLLLMHELTRPEWTGELGETLEGLRRRGWIRAWGIGSNRQAVEDLAAGGIRAPVMQFDWSPLHEHLPNLSGSLRINHGMIARSLQIVSALPESAKITLSRRLDRDISDPVVWMRLVLSLAIINNETGLFLLASKNEHHIRQLGEIINQGPDDAARILKGLGIPIEGALSPQT